MPFETPHTPDGHSFDRIYDPMPDKKQEQVDVATEQSKLSDGEDNIVYIQGPRFWAISVA